MREMKDSGVDWIGEIPKEWKTAKIDLLYNLRIEKVSDKDFQPLSVTMKGVVPQLETAAKTNDGDNRKLVREGDFVINSRSDRRGSCGISEYEGSVSLINTVLCPKDKINPGYYNWLFHCTLFSDEFYRWGHGIVDDLWTTNWQDMKRITLPVPSVSEQAKIADFLDRKCAEIDALTADIETQIDTLEQYKRSVITETVTKGLDPDAEMKDSGVEWIGEIPKDWNAIKIKYVTTLRNENGLFDPEKDIYIGLENVKGYSNDLVLTGSQYEKTIQSICRENDVLFGKLRPYLAKVIISPIDGFCTGEFLQFKDFYGDKRYLRYFLLEPGFIDMLNSSTYGAKMPRVKNEFILNSFISYPPIKVQHAIADFLDRKCAEIDAIISDKRKQLDILADYKKSLIYEYVTGKKEVPVS